MLRPVGSQPPSVYWRRRLLVVGSVVVVLLLIGITIDALASSGGSDGTPAGVAGNSAVSPSGSAARPHTSPPVTPRSTPPDTTTSQSHSQTPTSKTSSSAATVAACRNADLGVIAVTGKSTYHVGDKPTVEMQVTNQGARPCVQDLADKQIVLKVYNGESRVWGSHDCETLPGTNKETLGVNQPVRVSVNWSGLTSTPGCKGTRQRVGAGTYTLYASLAGKTGKAARFTIS